MGSAPYGASRFDETAPFANTYATPGWQRAQQAYEEGRGLRSPPRIIEGELVARETESSASFARATASFTRNSATAASPRIDGNKLTIDFDKAGEKRVLDSFVDRAG